MSKVTATQAKLNAKRRTALTAGLKGKQSASAESLSRSYSLPIEEVRTAMRQLGVNENG